MKSNKNLIFLGMMGSGKSTIGKLVSKRLKLQFIDVDHQIENKLKMKILDIFEIKGEKYFRNLEEKISLKYLREGKKIISLGGGAFLNYIVRKEILQNHLSFWLYWSPEILLKRLKNSKKRPLIYKAKEADILNLIKKRNKIYSKALFKIKCDNLSKLEIVDKIIKIYENN